MTLISGDDAQVGSPVRRDRPDGVRASRGRPSFRLALAGGPRSLVAGSGYRCCPCRGPDHRPDAILSSTALAVAAQTDFEVVATNGAKRRFATVYRPVPLANPAELSNQAKLSGRLETLRMGTTALTSIRSERLPAPRAPPLRFDSEIHESRRCDTHGLSAPGTPFDVGGNRQAPVD